jgi:hypothetical protein
MVQEGPRIAVISGQAFRDFAKRHATSPEIGPIQTSLDRGLDREIDFERILVGLWGCERLCAVACFHLYPSARDETRQVLKLDSVIVDERLRHRGLAGLLLAHSFRDLILDGARELARIYAHAVHPATLRLLRRLGFNGPQATGAPICDLGVEAENRDAFLKACEDQIRRHMDMMKLQCAFCRQRDKRARPWCLPRGETPDFS